MAPASQKIKVCEKHEIRSGMYFRYIVRYAKSARGSMPRSDYPRYQRYIPQNDIQTSHPRVADWLVANRYVPEDRGVDLIWADMNDKNLYKICPVSGQLG
jgi:hypothetical protein